MMYRSSRGDAEREGRASAGFEDVLLAGLAPDGGLFLPIEWPTITRADALRFKSAPYHEVAADIISRFAGGSFSFDELQEIAGEVYGAFDHDEVAPLTQVGDEDWILELYHGPTLAFKDFALQMLGRLFNVALERRKERLTVIAATSGDTGAAAIDALKGRDHVDVFVLHPEGRVTDVQRRMMTTVDDPHVHNLAIDGSFDDCQAIVKALFADNDFVKNVSLGGVNSINWARLAAQTVYYFTSIATLQERHGVDAPVNFVVPTGNFGDVYAGYAAKKMGAEIAMLGVATNENDILHRALSKGDYSSAAVRATASPSMDIQVASNFERLLFDVMEGDSAALSARMDAFKTDRAMMLSTNERTKIAAAFVSHATDGDATLAEIKRHFDETGALIDPHTAVARDAAQRLRALGALKGPVVTLSTAHPAKFPEAVKAATGKNPDLPLEHADLFDRSERFERSAATTEAVRSFIQKTARAAH